jgi:hypothetical protein
MRSSRQAGFAGLALAALAAAGCSPTGQAARMDAAPQAAFAAADAADAAGVQAYAPIEEADAPARKPAAFASLFGAAQRAPAEEPPPPGEFIAPAQAPVPVARPDFGDRPRQTEQTAASPATRAEAEARSLAAYERRAAGVPDDDEDEPEISPVPPAAVSASPFGAAPTRLAAASVSGPFILQGALHTGAKIGPSSNGLSLVEPPRRWRAAYDTVNVNCFPTGLRAALDQIATHFGSEVLVTSGARDKGRRGSLHRACKAADIRVAGVSPADVAAYARTVPGLNGVGTYRWVSVTHIDVRDERFAWKW